LLYQYEEKQMMGELSFRDMSQMGKVHLMIMMMKVVSMTIVVRMMIMMTMMVKTMPPIIAVLSLPLSLSRSWT
jgi:hypothetical protein